MKNMWMLDAGYLMLDADVTMVSREILDAGFDAGISSIQLTILQNK